MVDRGQYRRGAHTVTDLKYHMVWKTKYGYPVLREGIVLRLREVLRRIAEVVDFKEPRQRRASR
jgi:putative transposase